MSKLPSLQALATWWRSLDHTLKATPNIKPEVQDARAYHVFFRQLAAQWKRLGAGAFEDVEPNRSGLDAEGRKLAGELKTWLDDAKSRVFERDEGIMENDQIRLVRTVIGDPIRPLFEKWINQWYYRFDEFKADPLREPPHHILGFDWRRPELSTNPKAVTSGEQVPTVRGLWRFPREPGELYMWPRFMGRPVPPYVAPGDTGIETSTTIPGAPEEWDWLEYSWRLELSGIDVKLNEFYVKLSESPWLAVLLLNTFAADGVPRWQDSRGGGNHPKPMHSFVSMVWTELINQRYLTWCVRQFPPDTTLQDVMRIAPGPPSRTFGVDACGPMGFHAGFQGRVAHPLACVVAFLLDEVSTWASADSEGAAKVELSPRELRLAAVNWREVNPKGTQKQFAEYIGVSEASVSRHANFSELDELIAQDRRVSNEEASNSLDKMQVRKRPK